MVVAAFIFGIIILTFSLFFLLVYVNGHKSMRANSNALARQRDQHLKFQADLQARMERDARQFEAKRQDLLKNERGDDPDHRNIEHAA